MTNLVAATIGSGTIPQTRAILPAAQRGNQPIGEGTRTGIQVMLGNPEDVVSVDAFATSGITVGTTPVEILSPGTSPLPRCRMVIVQNAGSVDVSVGHKSDMDIVNEGIVIRAANVGTAYPTMAFPVLHNVSLWAATGTGTASVRVLTY